MRFLDNKWDFAYDLVAELELPRGLEQAGAVVHGPDALGHWLLSQARIAISSPISVLRRFKNARRNSGPVRAGRRRAGRSHESADDTTLIAFVVGGKMPYPPDRSNIMKRCNTPRKAFTDPGIEAGRRCRKQFGPGRW